MSVVSGRNLPFNFIVAVEAGEGTNTSFIPIANQGQSSYVYIRVLRAIGLCVLSV